MCQQAIVSGDISRMQKKQNEKLVYEQPVIEVIEFTLEDSIATSMDFGPSTICGEQTF